MQSPTLAGYLDFIRNYMGIGPAILPSDSPIIGWSYVIAKNWVNKDMEVIGTSDPAYPTVYALAVYNLAGHTLVCNAPDQETAPYEKGSDPPQRYFAYARKTFGLNGFVSGVVQSTNDQGTGASFVVPDAMQGLTFANLSQMLTPWGRNYLGFAQSMGPTVIGIS